MISKGLGNTVFKWILSLFVFVCSAHVQASMQSDLLKTTSKYMSERNDTANDGDSNKTSKSTVRESTRRFSIRPINCLTTYPEQACEMSLKVTLPQDLVATPVCLHQNGQRVKCWVPVDRFTFKADVKINNRDVFELKNLDLISFYRQEVKVSATQTNAVACDRDGVFFDEKNCIS